MAARPLMTMRLLSLCAAALVAAPAAAAMAVGDVIENADLPTLDGGRHALLSAKAQVNVLVFFRPRHDHSVETLAAIARCEQAFAGKPVHWVAIVSSQWAAEEVRATLREAGAATPVLVDEGDALYGRLGVRLHPVVVVADQKFQLVAYEPFR